MFSNGVHYLMCLCPFLADGCFRIWLYDRPFVRSFLPHPLNNEKPVDVFPSVLANVSATLIIS